MNSLRIGWTLARLYMTGRVYSCLACRPIVGPVKALPFTSGGAWGDNDEVCEKSGVMGCTPKTWYLIITRDRSEMDATARMKHLLIKIIERVTSALA